MAVMVSQMIAQRGPEGPAIALLRIAARHPRIIRENLESAA